MEKLKFALQVFTAIAALPVLTMMELNHNPKSLTAEQEMSKQKITKTAEGYYFNTSVNSNAGFQKTAVVKAANDWAHTGKKLNFRHKKRAPIDARYCCNLFIISSVLK
ncbi:hypothetical protein [Ferruginibacter sp. SUN106]|uniref:hypothetical protein n=1 Tax=Ferruginibacter sp. SUN106 TaxID=2978348 RepID=UPI003D36E360